MSNETYWDSIQIIKDPKKKEIAASFVQTDEGAVAGSESPCVRILAPDDYFPYKDNSGHYYIAYIYEPLPVDIVGTVTHTTGGACEPNSILVPQEMAATSTFTIPRGSTEVRVDLNLGTVLVDVTQTPDYKAAYTATLTSVTNGRTCGEPQCIKFFAGTSVIPPDPDPGPEPEPETELPPEDGQFPECDPQDCSALAAFDAEYPSSGYALFYSSATFDTLTNVQLRPNGWASLSVITNPPVDSSFTLSTTLRETGITSGPCDTAKLYSTPVASGGASAIRYVPIGVENVWNQTGITAESAQGSMGVYIWGRDSNGNRKDCRQNLVVSRAFAWKGDGYATGTTDTSVPIDVVAEAGGVFLEYTITGQRVKVGTGNDLTGAYFVSWENTWSIDPSGNASVMATATVRASDGGTLSITRTGADINGNWEPGTTLNMPRNTDRGAYTCYFENATNSPLLLAAFSVGDTQSIAEAEEFIRALERSQQEYTTPPYCSRIP